MTTPLQQIITRIGIRDTARITGVPRASIGLWIAGERPMSPERQRHIVDDLLKHYDALINHCDSEIDLLHQLQHELNTRESAA